ncbi:MAG: hypothetical protein R2695_06560 [Acidimicrobiales bacterium]
MNLPVPPGAARGKDMPGPRSTRSSGRRCTFDPDWLFISAGFDGHRADPLTDLGYSAGDIGDLVRELRLLARPAGRSRCSRVAMTSGAVRATARRRSRRGCSRRRTIRRRRRPVGPGTTWWPRPGGCEQPADTAVPDGLLEVALVAAPLAEQFHGAGHRIYLVGGVVATTSSGGRRRRATSI